MDDLPAGSRWDSLVALGDSFTEGLDDPDPGGAGYRGWADQVAGELARHRPGFRYANLAVRGRLLGAVHAEQVPVAERLAPALATYCGGVNDLLRPRVDLARLEALLDDGTARLRAAGADVVLFVGIDPSRRSVLMRGLRPRVEALNDAVRRVADRHAAVVVDLWQAPDLAHPQMWSTDRLHLSPLGHQCVAGAVLDALEVGSAPRWPAELPAHRPAAWVAARQDDVRWARTHLAPWVVRRLRGRSSGDAVTAKRPDLLPWET